MKRFFLGVIIFINIQTALADNVTVFCGKLDGDDWYGLEDNNGTTETLEGQWIDARLQNRNVRSGLGDQTFRGVYFDIRMFLVTESNYNSMNNRCRLGYVAQHTDGREWNRFAVKRAIDGYVYIAEGYMSGLDTETPRLPYSGVLRDADLVSAPQDKDLVFNSSLFLPNYLSRWIAGEISINLGLNREN